MTSKSKKKSLSCMPDAAVKAPSIPMNGSTVKRVSVCGREQASRSRTDGPGKKLGFVPSTAGKAIAFTSNAISELIHRYRTRQQAPRWANTR